jgi:ribosomal protein L3
MTQVFLIQRNVIPVTVIKVALVTLHKSNPENCGYNAIQIGYLEISAKQSLTKPN